MYGLPEGGPGSSGDGEPPELVRVAGRGAFVTFLPVGLTVLGAWAVLGPSAWWLRRRARESV